MGGGAGTDVDREDGFAVARRNRVQTLRDSGEQVGPGAVGPGHTHNGPGFVGQGYQGGGQPSAVVVEHRPVEVPLPDELDLGGARPAPPDHHRTAGRRIVLALDGQLVVALEQVREDGHTVVAGLGLGHQASVAIEQFDPGGQRHGVPGAGDPDHQGADPEKADHGQRLTVA